MYAPLLWPLIRWAARSIGEWVDPPSPRRVDYAPRPIGPVEIEQMQRVTLLAAHTHDVELTALAASVADAYMANDPSRMRMELMAAADRVRTMKTARSRRWRPPGR